MSVTILVPELCLGTHLRETPFRAPEREPDHRVLTNTFCHIPGIGEKTERALWSSGITSWESFTTARAASPRHATWHGHIEESQKHFAGRNPGYFAEKLPANQAWRLYRDFQDACAFLDIETTGLGWSDEITTIALYDGRTIRHYVSGVNLHDFVRDVADYLLLVTYNGKCFDIPFLERFFRARLPQAHIDLRYVLRSLGVTGGLKGCERALGICRPGLEDVDGFVAVLLWNEYRRHGNVKALETLLAYNIQDAVNLHALMTHAHNEKVKATPFATTHLLARHDPPLSPYQADPETLDRMLHVHTREWAVGACL